VSTTEAFDVAERAYGVVVLLRNFPEDLRGSVLNASDTRAFRVWSSAAPILPVTELSGDEERVLTYFRTLAPRLGERDIRISISRTLPAGITPPQRTELPGAPAGGSIETAAEVVTITVDHPDGYWLNFVGAIPKAVALWPSLFGGYLISVVFGVAFIAFWLVRRATRPLEDFASAAERLGKDLQTEPLDESAPNEVAQAARAFNQMQERLARLVRNRTELLAAVSHDLRTPITQLKLRAETIDNIAERDKYLAALEEMELIIATFLDYARSSFGNEERSRIDLASLVESICSDMTDGGADVSFAGGDPIQLDCKRLALKRGVSNLIDNAVKYAGGARVTAERRDGDIVIGIEDTGPGIAESDLDEVLMPFRRGDPSRSRLTGGIGLGLSIAQAVAHDHGGRIVLANRSKGGLRAEMILPA
jgi:signal transduction histidine kinase